MKNAVSEKITPCLWFDNQAMEAAKLYCTAFEKAKVVSESPIVTEIEVSGQHITLLNGGPMYQPNPSISLFYTCQTEAELDRVWKTLSKEGSVLMALGKYDWSEKFGWVNDRFGISWQVSLERDKANAQKITPFFLFTREQYGHAEEAIQHYTSIFRHSKIGNILRYGPNETPDKEGKIKLAQLTLEGQQFMVMESNHPHPFIFSEGVSLTVHCETQEEIDYYWSRLTESGEESMCGWLKDKYGVSWQIIPTILSKLMSDPAKAGKAAKAFMEMRKFDIEKIVQASIA